MLSELHLNRLLGLNIQCRFPHTEKKKYLAFFLFSKDYKCIRCLFKHSKSHRLYKLNKNIISFSVGMQMIGFLPHRQIT